MVNIAVRRLALMIGLALNIGTAEAAEGILLTIRPAEGQEEKTYDINRLMALRAVEFDTSTIWTEGRHRFRGVPLKSLLQDAGIAHGVVKARALNDYAVTIPVDELQDDAPIVAYSIDGATFTARDNGPLWIVYPYDSAEEYRRETVYGRSIWQLIELTGR